MESMRCQTVPTNDFVLVCDGPLTLELDAVIKEEQQKFGPVLLVLRLEKNGGLGKALNEGLKICKNENVARMDSDDISRPYRCEKQLELFERYPDICLSSGTVSEFITDPKRPTGKRTLPITDAEIRGFSRKRNPMNHPCVMFKKSAVESAGGYKETYHLFEDYYLWVRMLMKGYKARNTKDVLLDMRSPADMYLRRGGKKYAEDMLRFHQWMKRSGWSSEVDYLSGAVPHAVVCVLPNGVRKSIYSLMHKGTTTMNQTSKIRGGGYSLSRVEFTPFCASSMLEVV
jgi:glycosyltransferase involved in cell wall biosynthesis